MALTDSLVSYWKLDEASGNALDAHGSNELTETSGTIGSATGKIGNARDFEAGDSEYFVHTDNAGLSTGDIDFTFQFWINAESLSGFPVILRKGNGADVEYVLYYDASAARLKFGVAGSTNGTNYTEAIGSTFGSLSTGTWYHVVCWHDSVNNLLGISINGTANTNGHSAGVLDGGGDFELGASVPQSLYWDGLIDEVGFWKRVLTSDERTSLYNSGSGLAYPFSGGGAAPSHLSCLLGVGG